jgi:4-hydroxybenzoate polyprenyltransferase
VRVATGLIRASHPFPSLVNAVATGGIAALAGGDLPTSIRLALAMLFLQASIGAVNDLVDAPIDRAQKRSKPIPRGLVTERIVGTWGGLAAVLGLGLAAPSGPAAMAVAIVGVGLGYAYDLRLSRTVWSWLPLALALPLLPVFAWLGASGGAPPGLAVLALAAGLAGTGLIVGNGLVDFDRDAAAGKGTVAVRIGQRRAWGVHAAALSLAVVALVVSGPIGGTPGSGATAPFSAIVGVLRSSGIQVGAAVIAVGAGLLAARSASARERGWEVEVIGTAVLGLAWLAGAAA